jgi:hypothetical protein
MSGEFPKTKWVCRAKQSRQGGRPKSVAATKQTQTNPKKEEQEKKNPDHE